MPINIRFFFAFSVDVEKRTDEKEEKMAERRSERGGGRELGGA